MKKLILILAVLMTTVANAQNEKSAAANTQPAAKEEAQPAAQDKQAAKQADVKDAQPAQAEAKAEPAKPAKPVSPYDYALTMSLGDQPSDKDILITRKEGNVYSFKYCRAYDKKGALTPVAEIRRGYFLTPEKFSHASVNYTVLEPLFKSPYCELIGAPAYGLTQTPSTDQDGRSDTGGGTFILGVGTIISSGISLFSLATLHDQIKEIRRSSNTLTGWALFRSGKYPHGALGSFIGFMGAAAGAAYFGYQNHLDNVSRDAVVNSTYARFLTGSAVLVQDSMADFKRDFEIGLKTALKDKVFIEL
jgi:hypothetical protein